MTQTPLAKKLVLKPGTRAALIHAPEGYRERLNPLPEGTSVSEVLDGSFDLIQVFVRSLAEVNELAPQAMRALKPGGVLWFSYPKQSSKVKTDINRDRGWDALTREGWEGIASISIDETWSGVRFVKRSPK